MIRFFKLINDATDVGIMVYTDFWHGHSFPHEFFTRLLDLDHVVAIKFSQPSVVEFRETLTRFADKFAFVDNQTEHVTGNKLGEVGFLSHEAHFHLEHQLQLWNAIKKKDYTKAVELLAQLNWPFYNFHVSMAKTTTINDANSTKAAIEMIGLAAGPVRPPQRNLTREERAGLREILVRAGAPVKEATKEVKSKR